MFPCFKYALRELIIYQDESDFKDFNYEITWFLNLNFLKRILHKIK